MSHTIPFYDLYGESLVNRELHHVHVEDIAFRSKGLGWKIKPHRHDKLVQVVCTFDDAVSVQLDDSKYDLNHSCLVVIPTGVVHSFKFEPNIKGYVVSFSTEILNAMAKNDERFNLREMLLQPQVLSFRNPYQIKRFANYVELLRDELAHSEPDQQWVLEQLVQLLLISVKRQQQLEAFSDGEAGRDAKTLLNFKHYIDKHFREHLSVAEYASMLHVSVSTLNRLCQSRMNQGPKTLINERLVTQAKRLLIFTQQSICDIAYGLGFKDPAYFSRFFKQSVGMSAGEFRKSHDSQ